MVRGNKPLDRRDCVLPGMHKERARLTEGWFGSESRVLASQCVKINY